MKLYKKLAQPLHLTANSGTKYTSVNTNTDSGSGEQHVGFLKGWRYPDAALLGSNMFLDINTALTGSVPPPATTSPNQHLTRRFTIGRVVTEHRIKNMTTTPVKVSIYDITPRRDMEGATVNIGPVNDWNAGLNNQSVELEGGFADTNAVGSLQIGVTPFQSKQFTAKWKVKNVSTFMLDAGMEHHHYVKLNIGGMFDWERVKDVDLLKGISMYSMMIYSGGIIQQLGTTNVSTSSVTLDVVSNTRVVARMLEKSTVGKIQWNTLLEVPADAQQVVNEETDVIATVNVL